MRHTFAASSNTITRGTGRRPPWATRLLIVDLPTPGWAWIQTPVLVMSPSVATHTPDRGGDRWPGG
jgi:hypothetical protein